MPISTPSFDPNNERDPQQAPGSGELFEQESLEIPGITPAQAELVLKRLGGAVVEKHQLLEAIGWKARIEATNGGVTVHFDAHDELLDDLLRRFEEAAFREAGR